MDLPAQKRKLRELLSTPALQARLHMGSNSGDAKTAKPHIQIQICGTIQSRNTVVLYGLVLQLQEATREPCSSVTMHTYVNTIPMLAIPGCTQRLSTTSLLLFPRERRGEFSWSCDTAFQESHLLHGPVKMCTWTSYTRATYERVHACARLTWRWRWRGRGLADQPTPAAVQEERAAPTNHAAAHEKATEKLAPEVRETD